MACNLVLGESDTGTEIPMSGAPGETPKEDPRMIT
jgi:hypothetical protein